MVGTPAGSSAAVTPSTIVPFGALSSPVCIPVVQFTDTKAPAGAVGPESDGAESDGDDAGSVEAASEAAGVDAASEGAALAESDTRASVCVPHAARVMVRVMAMPARASVFFTRRA